LAYGAALATVVVDKINAAVQSSRMRVGVIIGVVMVERQSTHRASGLPVANCMKFGCAAAG